MSAEAHLNDLRLLAGIEDESQDDLLRLIIRLTESRLQALLESTEVPEILGYIVLEVSAARYNRIGSEGLSSHSQDGESLNFVDSDFDRFAADIETWKIGQKTTAKWQVKFL
ncbi:phage head-tail connector protein [Ileibacterium valens]|uniref:phage head-tail connector protein n=1 Tax=Ileibacterium valens TaxID=1862668 RepID=UPI0024B8B820|nr:phage head-tail connector protein [Ileibacterium valens]